MSICQIETHGERAVVTGSHWACEFGFKVYDFELLQK